MDNRKYVLNYWGLNKDNLTATKLLACNVIIPEITRKVLLDPASRGQFLSFIIEDGEELIIGADAVHSLRQIYGDLNEND